MPKMVYSRDFSKIEFVDYHGLSWSSLVLLELLLRLKI